MEKGYCILPPIDVLPAQETTVGAKKGTAFLRQDNKKVILSTVLNSPLTSRRQICASTGLSFSTVRTIVNELKSEGYLIEPAIIDSHRGRKPTLLDINASALSVIGIDLNELVGAAFDLKSSPCSSFYHLPDREKIELADVATLVQTIIKNMPREAPQPAAIGISVPGRINVQTGDVTLSTNLSWNNVPLGTFINNAVGLPVAIESNLVCLVLGEACLGQANGVNDFIYLHCGFRGIGSGIVANGRIIRGWKNTANEIRHLQIYPDGLECECGRRGCLGTYACGEAILRRAQTDIKNAHLVAPPLNSLHDVAEAAIQGHTASINALRSASLAIGRYLSNLTLALGPELIIVGGSSMVAGDILIPVIRDTFVELCTQKSDFLPKIVNVYDSETKSAAGAARIASHRLLLNSC